MGGILFILIIQLFFKLYFKERINLKKEKFLAGGGNNFNTKLEFYLNKMIKLNKQMSLLWIWFGGIITRMFGLSMLFINCLWIYIIFYKDLYHLILIWHYRKLSIYG